MELSSMFYRLSLLYHLILGLSSADGELIDDMVIFIANSNRDGLKMKHQWIGLVCLSLY